MNRTNNTLEAFWQNYFWLEGVRNLVSHSVDVEALGRHLCCALCYLLALKSREKNPTLNLKVYLNVTCIWS